jgi:hypothetical protein
MCKQEPLPLAAWSRCAQQLLRLPYLPWSVVSLHPIYRHWLKDFRFLFDLYYQEELQWKQEWKMVGAIVGADSITNVARRVGHNHRVVYTSFNSLPEDHMRGCLWEDVYETMFTSKSMCQRKSAGHGLICISKNWFYIKIHTCGVWNVQSNSNEFYKCICMQC